MAEKGFAQRLQVACDKHAHAPPYSRGRQTWLREQMNVSHEAVRKWFAGESRPRPDKMRKLAKVLEVDEAWLSLGIIPDLEPAERRARNALAEGATNVAMGFLQMAGGHVAFPDDNDPRAEFVDFYAIMRGTQTAYHITLGQRLSAGLYKFVLPKDYDMCTPIGVVPTGPLTADFLRLEHALIERHAIDQGGYYELMINKNGHYSTGADTWFWVKDFNHL